MVDDLFRQSRVKSRICTRQWGPCLISPHFCESGTFALDTFYDFEPQKRSRVSKLGAQTQHRVIQRFLPPYMSKQSEITCARDKGVVFHNIGQALPGSTDVYSLQTTIIGQVWKRITRCLFGLTCGLSVLQLYHRHLMRVIAAPFQLVLRHRSWRSWRSSQSWSLN